MRKPTKSAVASAAESFVQDLKNRFPGMEAEIVYQALDGFDVYVRLGLPLELEESLIEVLNSAADVAWRSREETGVAITAAPVKMEALTHG